MSLSSLVCNFLHSPSLILWGSKYSRLGEAPKPLQHYFLELEFCECERPYEEAKPISHFFKDLLHRKYVEHVRGQVKKLLP